MSNKVCSDCGLAHGSPHTSVEDCMRASRVLADCLRKLLAGTTPFCSCWEFDPWDLKSDGEDYYKTIADAIGFTKEA